MTVKPEPVPDRVCSFFRGGLGDVLARYVEPGGDAGRWAELKRLHPTTAVEVVAVTVNPEVGAFFARHPHVDRVRAIPYAEPCRPLLFAAAREAGAVPLRHAFGPDAPAWAPPEIHLDAEEAAVAAEVLAAGPYVAFHPFAGQPDRSLVHNLDTEPLVHWISDHNDGQYRCVILGGSSTRLAGDRATPLAEGHHVARPGVVNLVGRHSVRLHAYLARHADMFVGSYSAFGTLAQQVRVPCLLFAPPHLRPTYAFDAAPVHRASRLNRSTVVYWPDLAHVDLKAVVVAFLERRADWPFHPIDELLDL